MFSDKSGKYGIVKTPYKNLKVNIPYAYRHFYKNTYNTNRDYLKGAFFDILQNPMIIAEKETRRGVSTYFFKVYRYGNDKIGVFSIGIAQNGHISYKTMYRDESLNRIKEIINMDDKNIKFMRLE